MTYWGGACCCVQQPPDFSFDDLYVFVPCQGTFPASQYNDTQQDSDTTQVTPPCDAQSNDDVDYTKYFGQFIALEKETIQDHLGLGTNDPDANKVYLFAPNIKFGSGINVDGEFDHTQISGQKACITFCGRFVNVKDEIEDSIDGCRADGVAEAEVPEGWPVCDKCSRLKFQYYNLDNLTETNANFKGSFSEIISGSGGASAADTVCSGGDDTNTRECNTAKPVECDPEKPYIKLRCKRIVDVGPNGSFCKNFSIVGTKSQFSSPPTAAGVGRGYNGIGNAANGFHYLKHDCEINLRIEITYAVWLRKLDHPFFNPDGPNGSNPTPDTGPKEESTQRSIIFDQLKRGTNNQNNPPASSEEKKDIDICDTIAGQDCVGSPSPETQNRIPLISEWYTGLRDWRDLDVSEGTPDPQDSTSLWETTSNGSQDPEGNLDQQRDGMYVGGMCGIQIEDITIPPESSIKIRRLQVIENTEEHLNVETEVVDEVPALAVTLVEGHVSLNLRQYTQVDTGIEVGGVIGGFQCSGLLRGVQRIFGSAKLQKRFGLSWDAMDCWPSRYPNVAIDSGSAENSSEGDFSPYFNQNGQASIAQTDLFLPTDSISPQLADSTKRWLGGSNGTRHACDRDQGVVGTGNRNAIDARFFNNFSNIFFRSTTNFNLAWPGISSIFSSADTLSEKGYKIFKAPEDDKNQISEAITAKIPFDKAVLNYTIQGHNPWENQVAGAEQPGIKLDAVGATTFYINKFSSIQEEDSEEQSELEQSIRNEIKLAALDAGLDEDEANRLRDMPFAARRSRGSSGPAGTGPAPGMENIKILNKQGSQEIRTMFFRAPNSYEDCGSPGDNSIGEYVDFDICEIMPTIEFNPGCSLVAKRGEDYLSCNQLPFVDAMYADGVPELIQRLGIVANTLGMGTQLGFFLNTQSGFQFGAELKSLTGQTAKRNVASPSSRDHAVSKIDWTFDFNFKGRYIAVDFDSEGTLTKPPNCDPSNDEKGDCAFPIDAFPVDRNAYVNEVLLWGMPCALGTDDTGGMGEGEDDKRCFEFQLLFGSASGGNGNIWPDCTFSEEGNPTQQSEICKDPDDPTAPAPDFWPCINRGCVDENGGYSGNRDLIDFYPPDVGDPLKFMFGKDSYLGFATLARPLERGFHSGNVQPLEIGEAETNPNFEKMCGVPFNDLTKETKDGFVGENVTHRFSLPDPSVSLDKFFNKPTDRQIGLTPTSGFMFNMAKLWWGQAFLAPLSSMRNWSPFSGDIPSEPCGNSPRSHTAMHTYEWNRVVCPQHIVTPGAANPSDTTSGAGFFSNFCNVNSLQECGDAQADGLNCNDAPVWSEGSTANKRAYFKMFSFPVPTQGSGGDVQVELRWNGGEHRVNWYSTHTFLEVSNEKTIPEAYRGWKAGLWDAVKNEHYGESLAPNNPDGDPIDICQDPLDDIEDPNDP